jgi:hypothetical protein
MKYLPPFELIRGSIETSTVNGELRVDMSYEDVVRLVRTILSGLDLDEAWYLRTYEDIASAIQTGDVQSAKQHFVDDGYFEGRRPFAIPVDERWYLSQYPDVADSIRLGVVTSAQEHFDKDGYREGRLPFNMKGTDTDAPADRKARVVAPVSSRPAAPRAGQRNGVEAVATQH